jgi:hypothetical protein
MLLSKVMPSIVVRSPPAFQSPPFVAAFGAGFESAQTGNRRRKSEAAENPHRPDEGTGLRRRPCACSFIVNRPVVRLHSLRTLL